MASAYHDQEGYVDLDALRAEVSTTDMYTACWLVLNAIPIRSLFVLGSHPRRVRFLFDNSDGSAEVLVEQFNRQPETAIVALADVRETMRLLYKAVDRAVDAYVRREEE